MLQEFKKFISRGNVLDLAVAVIIGAAFGKIVTSLTDDIIMPIIGKLSGGLDFSSHFIVLGTIPANYAGSPTDYAALKKAGVALLGWGEFATQAVNFLIIAFIIFLMVRAINKLTQNEPVAAADPADIALLKEIRDELRARPSI
jgi:large conductance mechanosensitive channel